MKNIFLYKLKILPLAYNQPRYRRGNDSQIKEIRIKTQKIIGIALIVIGAIVLLVGGRQIMDAIEAQQQTEAPETLLGGASNELIQELGVSSAIEQAKTKGIIFMVVGLCGIVAGGLFAKKAKPSPVTAAN
ncbi:hypothetical protein [Agarivorans gilvus]|uniref:Uncharacterized protein n=1 Tax=Agarivorans gilvus TaxID=680279 RepID=A0ABQ1I408_9ALTE|nr:hypothetical protein [Agarivorans gilvus]GGB14396.1 hypothetical protein GCM10007414_29810 [Agarivorans gilvus]